MFVAIAGGCDGDRICQAAKRALDMGIPFQVVPTDGGQRMLLNAARHGVIRDP
jgi:acetyl-CoA carboxylase beta subunit